MVTVAPALNAKRYPRGAEWRRWDLHVHTPDTAKEDEYKDWDSFIQALSSQTEVQVVGVTDYLSVANYARLLEVMNSKGLGNIELLIPNIEFRIAPQTTKGSAINLHLLIDPTDPQHVELINSALSRLCINYKNQPYSCIMSELRRLGEAFSPSLTTEGKKYEEGVNQFKVDFSVFRQWFDNEEWLAKNSLVAVSAGDDGPSGLTKESGWSAIREEIWRFSHIVFSGNPQNRQFWLATEESTREGAIKLGAPKPCVHGSDAHKLDKLFRPTDQRYCWIKADPSFEGLRQILYEPDERVYIGQQPPIYHDLSRIISEITIRGGPTGAFPSGPIVLNSRLVSVIGQKGSGKSALADLISYAGGDASLTDKTSFLFRAAEYLGGIEVLLKWADARSTAAVIGDAKKRPKLVRYLSQSFVERLCSEDYAGADLAHEIEAVIFRHLDPTDTLNASSFSQLRELRTKDTTRERISIAGKIRALIAEDEQLRQAIKTVPEKKKRIEELDKEWKSLEKQLPKAQNELEAQAQKKAADLRQQLAKLQTTVASHKQNALRIEQLQSELGRFKSDFSEFRRTFLQAVKEIGIAPGIVDLELEIRGESAIADRKSAIETLFRSLEGLEPGAPEPTIRGVTKQIEAANSAVAADQARKTQIQQLQKRIANILQEVQRFQGEVVAIESDTAKRLKALREERLSAYEALFTSWKKEQEVLAKLYEPVQEKLAAGDKDQQLLDFYIRWNVDLENWLERGNALFDQRKAHPFEAPLKFREIVQKLLMPGWSTGNPAEIRKGMDALLQKFKDDNIESFLKGSISHALLLDWVFDYSHIRLSYGLRYNKTELEKLSPGTKGIVLLILYLAMDTDDTRPLIVDQPEENLDSESVYSLLSRYFRRAKLQRQVVVITHNPNLVVNTDSEQIVVANATRQQGLFPQFSYISGSLEDSSTIRRKVCNILEGGEKAFLEREKRYALNPEAIL